MTIDPTSGPAIHSGRTTRTLMVHVVVALLPICVAAIWRHGSHAAILLGVSIFTALVLDTICDRRNASEGISIVIGIVLALLLPITAPWWTAAVGSAMAVVIGKHAFGGIGNNLFNPAALGRVLLMAVAPKHFLSPQWEVDAITLATPLAKELGARQVEIGPLLLGEQTVALGEAAPLAVLAGGIALVALRKTDWLMPLAYLATISILALLLPGSARTAGHAPWLEGNALLHLLSGGAMLAAFFMVTDPVTTPFTRSGSMSFCVLAAAYTMVVRYYTPYPDAVVIGLVLANATVPIIDRATLGKFVA